MQSDEGIFSSHKQYERTLHNRRYFQKVIDVYAEFREYAPVVACNYDRSARGKKLHPAIIHFLADVDLATKAVLKTPELIQKWFSLVAGEPVDPVLAGSIVNRCARIYRAKGLAPYQYFQTMKSRAAKGAA